MRDTEQASLYVPGGLRQHGFQALTDPADVSYRIDREHDPSQDVTIAHDDPELAIPWPLPITAMSDRDRRAAPLSLAWLITRIMSLAVRSQEKYSAMPGARSLQFL